MLMVNKQIFQKTDLTHFRIKCEIRFTRDSNALVATAFNSIGIVIEIQKHRTECKRPPTGLHNNFRRSQACSNCKTHPRSLPSRPARKTVHRMLNSLRTHSRHNLPYGRIQAVYARRSNGSQSAARRLYSILRTTFAVHPNRGSGQTCAAMSRDIYHRRAFRAETRRRAVTHKFSRTSKQICVTRINHTHTPKQKRTQSSAGSKQARHKRHTN